MHSTRYGVRRQQAIPVPKRPVDITLGFRAQGFAVPTHHQTPTSETRRRPHLRGLLRCRLGGGQNRQTFNISLCISNRSRFNLMEIKETSHGLPVEHGGRIQSYVGLLQGSPMAKNAAKRITPATIILHTSTRGQQGSRSPGKEPRASHTHKAHRHTVPLHPGVRDL